MIYTPKPLASHRTLTTSDLEENLAGVVQVLGGNAYLNSEALAYDGAVGRENLSPSIKIPNALRSEPYSIAPVQVQIAYTTDVNDDPSRGYGEVVLPAAFGIESAQLVGGAFAYTALVGGSTAIATSLAVKVGNVTPFGASISVGLVPPLTAVAIAPTPNPYGFALSGQTRVSVQIGNVSFAGGSGDRFVKDIQVILFFKVKHIA